jgi:hypothetical protein
MTRTQEYPDIQTVEEPTNAPPAPRSFDKTLQQQVRKAEQQRQHRARVHVEPAKTETPRSALKLFVYD